MLYDKRWEKKVDPINIATLITWLEQRPAKDTYVFSDCDGMCLYAQYLSSFGHPAQQDFGKYEPKLFNLFERLHQEPFYSIASTRPWKFGKALERARKALAG